MFARPFLGPRLSRIHSSTPQPPQHDTKCPAQQESCSVAFEHPKNEASKSSQVSVQAFLVLARMAAAPPQRLIEHIDWTPACRSRNSHTNHTPQRPGPAITHGCLFPPSVHLQTAVNTYQPPIAHITMSPAVTLRFSPGSSLSGSGQFVCPSVEQDRRHLGG